MNSEVDIPSTREKSNFDQIIRKKDKFITK